MNKGKSLARQLQKKVLKTLAKADQMEQHYIDQMKAYGINVILRDKDFLIKQSEMLRQRFGPIITIFLAKNFWKSLMKISKNSHHNKLNFCFHMRPVFCKAHMKKIIPLIKDKEKKMNFIEKILTSKIFLLFE